MDNRERSKITAFIGPSILMLVGSYILHLSWFKWPDLLIDYGRELYVPWQITQGKVLYADINHLYGPLSHYFNAFLFQIFGAGLSTLAFFNIGLVVLLTSIIYYLLKSSFGHLIATVAGICFLVIFAFSQYTGISNYNFVCPYSHEITYGIFLFFCSLIIFKQYLTRQKIIYAGLMGFITGLIFLTKVEIFIAGFISILSGLIFVLLQLKPAHPRKHILNFLIFFLLPIVSFFIYFSIHMPVRDAFNSIIASYRNIFVESLTNNIYYLKISGLDNPTQSVVLMFRQIIIYLSYFIFAGFIAYLFARFIKKNFVYGIILIIFALFLLLIFFGIVPVNGYDIARPYPVFITALLVFLTFDLIRKREDKLFVEHYLPFILLTLFSLLLLLKMILNTHLYHYGFALAMPAHLVIVTLLLYFIPRLISRRGNKNAALFFAGLFIFLTLVFYFNVTRNIYEMKNYAVGRGPDRFFTFDSIFFSHGEIINKTLASIDKLMTKDDTFIVMPDGVMLNYLSRRRNPSRYFEFTPNFVQATGEKIILNDISGNRPSFIILAKKDTSEHGAKSFGVDYARNIYSWIIDNYDKVTIIGEEELTGDNFGVIIAKKR